MFILEVLSEAETEIREACEWYEHQQTHLGSRLVEELDHYLEIIRKDPLLFLVKFSEIYRFAVLKIFPYFIVFRVDVENSIIYIISFFHTSRHPLAF